MNKARVNETRKDIKEALLMAARLKLKNDPQINKNKWMTQEILNLMGDKRRWKGRDETKYKIIQRRIKQEIIQVKDNYMRDKCKEVEDLERKHDSF